MHRLLLGLLAVALLLAAPAARADEDDEPITVPFEDMTDMTDEEWEEIEARQIAFQIAWMQWQLRRSDLRVPARLRASPAPVGGSSGGDAAVQGCGL
jgi:hypothetical protein